MQAPRIKRPLNGVLMLDKALGASSNAALQQAKRLYQAAKAGHAGTLDPLATGLLPVLFGEATKFSSDLLDADKSYLAQIKLGVSTATADAEGEVLATRAVKVTAEQLVAALNAFRGEIQQTPPLYSALKHAGKPLYAYARAGIDIARAPRRVTIHALVLQWFEGDRLALSITCSKGTYIRSIAHDLGELLGCGAHLAALRRSAAGRFGLDSAHTLQDLEAMSEAERDRCLLPADTLLQELPEVCLEPAQQARFLQGQVVPWAGPPQPRVRVYGSDGTLLGVGELGIDGAISPKRVIAAAQQCALGADAIQKIAENP
ncbi:MAG: tRNA pseudouridine(55) synthase TruB [Burkholderiales bacterium]|nr:tRNA pseudouridine(55) synthase TruB [Burkholderiales bacterium]